MKRKLWRLLAGAVLFSACTGNTEGETPEDRPEETEMNEEASEQDNAGRTEEPVREVSRGTSETDGGDDENSEDSVEKFSGLINETTFSNEFGYQAWEDYVQAADASTAADFTDLENLEGTSSAEIDELFSEEVERHEVGIAEQEKMVLYRFPDEEGGEFSEVSEFLAEAAFYFYEDHLVFSSVTPGFYNLDITGAYSQEEVAGLSSISELEGLDPQPQVFTVAETSIQGETYHQIMVPVQPLPEQDDSVMTALYLLVQGEDIVDSAVLPFEQAGQDFPTFSFLVYRSYAENVIQNPDIDVPEEEQEIL